MDDHSPGVKNGKAAGKKLNIVQKSVAETNEELLYHITKLIV